MEQAEQAAPDHPQTTGDYVNAVKDAIVTMITALPEITIKDEDDEFVSKEFKEEYEKIYRDVVKYTTPIIKALNGLPVYYRHLTLSLSLSLSP